MPQPSPVREIASVDANDRARGPVVLEGTDVALPGAKGRLFRSEVLAARQTQWLGTGPRRGGDPRAAVSRGIHAQSQGRRLAGATGGAGACVRAPARRGDRLVRE